MKVSILTIFNVDEIVATPSNIHEIESQSKKTCALNTHKHARRRPKSSLSSTTQVIEIQSYSNVFSALYCPSAFDSHQSCLITRTSLS